QSTSRRCAVSAWARFESGQHAAIIRHQLVIAQQQTIPLPPADLLLTPSLHFTFVSRRLQKTTPLNVLRQSPPARRGFQV
ncbi:Striated muscle-specific serine/threonine-protein kinase, partial [Frankliniella fusca]